MASRWADLRISSDDFREVSDVANLSASVRHSVVHPLKWRTQHLSTHFTNVITVRQQQNFPTSETCISESVPSFMQLHHLGASG